MMARRWKLPRCSLLSWVLVLFGLMFAAVGGLMLCGAAEMAVNSVRALGWVEVPATIESVDMKVYGDGEGSSEEVQCVYTYEFNGQTFAGNRVGFKRSADNTGTWHRDTYERLERHKDRGEPVSCYVNPSHPSESVLDRGLRLGPFLLQLLLPVGIGVPLIFLVVYVRRGMAREAELKAAHPDEPWLWKPEMSGGVVRMRPRTVEFGFWAGTIFWFGLSGLMCHVVLSGVFHENGPPSSPFAFDEQTLPQIVLTVVFLVLPFVGLVGLAQAVSRTRRYRWFKGSRFELETVPGVIGGHLRGDLVLLAARVAGRVIDVRLRCLRCDKDQLADEAATIVWEEARTIEVDFPPYGEREVRLPLDFQIPYSCRPCRDPDAGDRVWWALQVRTSTFAKKADLSLNVPVYQTSASDPAVGPSAESMAAKRAVVESPDPPASAQVREEFDVTGRITLICSCWPGFGYAFLALVLLAFFGGVVAFAVFQMTRGEWELTVFGSFFYLATLIPVSMIVAGTGLWRITFGSDAVTAVRSYGIARRRKTIPRNQIVRVKHVHRSTLNDTKWFSVYLVLDGGRKVKVAGMVRGRMAARWLQRRIEKELGLEPKGAVAVSG